MNEQFYELPEEKQLRIVNAGFEVFGTYDYKHASTDLIAAKAGISKGLLFYYFHNKKSLFLHLYSYAEKLIIESVIDEGFSGISDFFQLCGYAAQKKGKLLEKNPHVYDFLLKSFYSSEEVVSSLMKEKTAELYSQLYQTYFTGVDFAKFKPDVDPMEIFRMLTWMMEGYMNEQQRTGIPATIDDLMDKFYRWSDMLKKLSYKEEYQS